MLHLSTLSTVLTSVSSSALEGVLPMTMPVPRSGLQGSYGRDGGCHRTPNLPYLQSSPGDFITPGGGASESGRTLAASRGAIIASACSSPGTVCTTTTISFPPELRLVHPAHPLRHATQVEKSSRGRLRPICCLAAPRAREARRRGSVRDGARDVKTVKPAVAAASCAVVALPRCSGDEGVRSGARERCSPDPREARGVGGAAAPHPAVVRPQELGA